MPLPSKSDKDCVKKTIKAEKAAGKSQEQAVAIAMNNCGKSKKEEKNECPEEKIDKMMKSLDKDLDDIYSIRSYLISIRDMLKYPNIGEAYKKIQDKVAKDMEKISSIKLEKLKQEVCNEIEEMKKMDSILKELKMVNKNAE